MNSRTIRVLSLADEHYAMPLAVMGRSLLENHRSGRPLLLKVIDGGITPSTRERVERSWRNAAGSPARWEWVAPEFGQARRLPVWGRVPALTYARLFLDAYFAESEDQVILLDSDALVLADVAGLHDTDLEGCVIAACGDPFIPTVSSIDGLHDFARSGMPADTPYFNAGMMVADLRRWRQERVGERSLQYIEREHRHLRQYDQDALNAVLAGRWKLLDGSWNTQPRTPWESHCLARFESCISAAVSSPGCIAGGRNSTGSTSRPFTAPTGTTFACSRRGRHEPGRCMIRLSVVSCTELNVVCMHCNGHSRSKSNHHSGPHDYLIIREHKSYAGHQWGDSFYV